VTREETGRKEHQSELAALAAYTLQVHTVTRERAALFVLYASLFACRNLDKWNSDALARLDDNLTIFRCSLAR
jgi:hypothetical protein